ncbi:MAG: hypothetical protein D6680_19880 [Cyanobacteria bacterium J007]|jgi:hypothetical protein|nr:MAG: hypothetical protein D6680_19880 [Cyanobacteria bacterium J007]
MGFKPLKALEYKNCQNFSTKPLEATRALFHEHFLGGMHWMKLERRGQKLRGRAIATEKCQCRV